MARPLVSPLQQQIRRVSRRLFVQTLLDNLVWCWAGALVLTAAWFLAQPFLSGHVDDELRWWVASGLLGAATLLAVGLALWRRPSPLEAALAVDARFNLKERVTTSLTLSPAQALTPAGQALLADVNKHVSALNMRERFPLRLSWSAALVPVSAGVLALIAFFYEPSFSTASARGDASDAQALAEAKALQEKLNELKKDALKNRKDTPKSEELKELEAAWNKLLEDPPDLNDKEKVRERVQAIRDLEEKMKDRTDILKGLADKNDSIKKQLEKLGKLDARGDKLTPKEGPAKDLQEALAKGQFQKAQEELEKLQKKLAENKLSKEELKQLQDQMKDLQGQLKRLAEQQDRKEQLKRERDNGNLNEEQFKEALERLEQEGADLEKLQDLAKLLEECQACLGKGKMSDAAGKLKEIAGKLKEIELTEEELRELEENQRLLEEARLLMAGRGNGLGKEANGPPGRERPIAPDGKTKSHDAKQKAEVDLKGNVRVTGFSRGGTFSRVPAQDVQGAFRQAEQEAPEAIERQRIAPEAAEMLKGYYENLGGQKRR